MDGGEAEGYVYYLDIIVSIVQYVCRQVIFDPHLSDCLTYNITRWHANHYKGIMSVQKEITSLELQTR